MKNSILKSKAFKLTSVILAVLVTGITLDESTLVI